MTTYRGARPVIPMLAIAGLLAVVGLGPGHLATPDAHVILAQARNVVETGSFAVPAGVGNPTHGNLAQGRDGQTYSVYNVGHVLLYVPLYALATALPSFLELHPHYTAAFLASFAGLAAHFVTAVALFVWLRALGVAEPKTLILTLIFAVGTVSLPGSADGYSHPFETAAIALAFLVACGGERHLSSSRGRSALVAGLLLGAGVLFRPSALLALPGLCICFARRRDVARALVGVSPGVAGSLAYNYLRFESVLDSGYPAAWRLANGPSIGEYGFSAEAVPENVVNLLFSVGKGLFWYAPVLILCVFGWRAFYRRSPRSCFGVAVAVAAYLMFYAGNFAWHGSVWSWGPRYIAPLAVLLVVPMAFAVSGTKRRWALGLLAVVSVTLQVAAVGTDYRRHLIAEYVTTPDQFENRLLHSPGHSPLIGQFGSFAHVLRQSLRHPPLRLYLSQGPWLSEARPASNQMMLADSIDLNAVNVWWVRLSFMPVSRPVSVAAMFLGMGCLVGSVVVTWRIWTHQGRN